MNLDRVPAATNSLTFRNPAICRFLGLFCLALFIGLQAFATCGALHKAIHADAASPGHHCLLTALSDGKVTVSSGELVFVTGIPAFLFSLPIFQGVIASSADYRLSPGRAPPRF